MIATELASPAKRSSSGDSESSLKLSLEASELRYRRLFETAQDGILILDANTGRIIDVNPFLLDGLGKGADFTLCFKVTDSAPQTRDEEPLVAVKKPG
jgi:PAS domain-containing protein